jgi:hypothetical protein
MQIVKVNKHQESQGIDWLQVGVGVGGKWWRIVTIIGWYIWFFNFQNRVIWFFYPKKKPYHKANFDKD